MSSGLPGSSGPASRFYLRLRPGALILLLFGVCAVIFVLMPASPSIVSQAGRTENAVSQLPRSQRLEAVRRNIRDVTPASVHRPPPTSSGMVERLPAVPVKNPKPAELPVRTWPRPVVVSPGILKSGNTTIAIAGIEPFETEHRCGEDAQGTWPCGRMARTALQRLVRGRTLTCKRRDETLLEEPQLLVTRCQVGGYDIGGWLVAQGWARATDAIAYGDKETAARKAQRGIWASRRPSLAAN